MPHIIVDYSANMEQRTDLAGLCEALRQAAIETGVFPVAGIRVRAMRADHAAIGDGGPQHGYVDITVRLRGGRDLATRKAAAARIFAAAEGFLAPAMREHSVALSMEMRDIDPELSPKTGTISEHLKGADRK
ncbi:5-carboxymethyl-2-hydroxymuconate Delta-isomerase [Ruegeria sediminis]|uniref:5-carboxymethyl-2-hydroxymuconate Delta-isomerase n=1 Tax=Ruegeria sediminis TaxID=2583820 RepID=A0ABY2WW28_9RHOB|nr:5-carboxymethyl-2-hydroxymuconate Delta-isomerase [Ruegeria sediminis]TMV06953.1 5-carboxymethyl-2-hydroxymuconate Delta-isomerase [Ruegeria sediminis]